MKSRAWFEAHGHMRQVRLYEPDRKLFHVKFPADAFVLAFEKGWYGTKGKSKRITRIVVRAPDGDRKIEVGT